jgi:hypothetical protein
LRQKPRKTTKVNWLSVVTFATTGSDATALAQFVEIVKPDFASPPYRRASALWPGESEEISDNKQQ